MKHEDVALAFVQRRDAKAGTAETDGQTYRLHGHPIAQRCDQGVSFNWCGYHTQTTARHMNHILRAMGSSVRASASKARLDNEAGFIA